MGYKQVGTLKNGQKKWKITIELGNDIFGKRQRITRIFEGTLAQVKLKDAELTEQYYRKQNYSNVKDLTFEQEKWTSFAPDDVPYVENGYYDIQTTDTTIKVTFAVGNDTVRGYNYFLVDLDNRLKKSF